MTATTVTPEDLKRVKQYMHIDHDDDDELISKLWSAAVLKLQKIGISVFFDDGWLAAAGLTLQWYDGTPLQPGIQQLINGMKLENPVF